MRSASPLFGGVRDRSTGDDMVIGINGFQGLREVFPGVFGSIARNAV